MLRLITNALFGSQTCVLVHSTAVVPELFGTLLSCVRMSRLSESIIYTSVCPQRYLQKHVTDLRQIFVHDPCGPGLVLLWRRCNRLCTFGFVDVTFGRNGPYSVFQRRDRV